MRITKKLTLIGYCSDFAGADTEELSESCSAVCEVDDRQIILEYLYFKKFDKYYTELGWWLEPGAKDFVKDFENKWWKNQIDEFGITHSLEFNDFVNNYLIEIKIPDDELEDALDEYKGFVEDELDDLSSQELKELWETCSTGMLDIEVVCEETGQSVYGYVDLPEIDEENEEE